MVGALPLPLPLLVKYVTVETVADGIATGRTKDGLALLFHEPDAESGAQRAVTLRPTDFSLTGGPASVAGQVANEVYLGADLHYVLRTEGGAVLQATARDDDARPAVGDAVTLFYDPARVHVLEHA